MSTAIDEVDHPRIILKTVNGRAVVSPAKASELLDCGLSRVYKLMETHELPSFLIGGRRKIAVEDVAKLLEQKRALPYAPRTMPWDVGGLAPRQRWPRLEDKPVVERAEEAGKRPVGQPRKTPAPVDDER